MSNYNSKTNREMINAEHVRRSRLAVFDNPNNITNKDHEKIHKALISNEALIHTCGKDKRQSENDVKTLEQIQENIDEYDDLLSVQSRELSDMYNVSPISRINSMDYRNGDLMNQNDNLQHHVRSLNDTNVNLQAEIEKLVKENHTIKKNTQEFMVKSDKTLFSLTKNVEFIKDKLFDLSSKLESSHVGKYEKEKNLKNLIGMLKNIPERLNEVLISYKELSSIDRSSENNANIKQHLETGDNYVGNNYFPKGFPKLVMNQTIPGKAHSIKVICRIKPDIHNCLSVPTTNTIYLPPFRHFQNGVGFQLNKILCANSNQQDLFNEVSPILESCFTGCNVCVLTYGQSGSGKTYTMLGTDTNPGLIMRSMSELKRLGSISSSTKYKFYLSILEVYNEVIYDLMGYAEDKRGNEVKPRVMIQDNGQSVQIKNVSEAEISNENELEYYISKSQKLRNSSLTAKNHYSSRSHYLVMIRVVGCNKSMTECTNRGVLMLCDLAGSENCSGLDMKERNESKYINKSITMLTSVFDALYKKMPVVPYRDSKLTHLLKPSLMGNAKCVFIATICSQIANLLDTYRTLNVAKKVEMITFSNRTYNQ